MLVLIIDFKDKEIITNFKYDFSPTTFKHIINDNVSERNEKLFKNE